MLYVQGLPFFEVIPILGKASNYIHSLITSIMS